MEGLRRHQDKVRFVLVHHEEAAAFMAAALVRGRAGPGVRPPLPGLRARAGGRVSRGLGRRSRPT
jgi:hypothetical protein